MSDPGQDAAPPAAAFPTPMSLFVVERRLGIDSEGIHDTLVTDDAMRMSPPGGPDAVCAR